MYADKELTFGSFLRKKRQEKEMSLRKFAELVEMSPVHISYLETNQRHAPKDEKLERMAKTLQLCKEDEELFFDLAAESALTPRVSGDLPEYIMSNDLIKVALRTAKDVDATDSEWMEFIERLQKRKHNEKGGSEDGS